MIIDGQFGLTEHQEEIAEKYTEEGIISAANYIKTKDKKFLVNPYGHASGGLKSRSWQYGFDREVEYSK